MPPDGGLTNAYKPGIEACIAGRVWPAAEALSDYLDYLATSGLPLIRDAHRVLELGSGAGLAGISLFHLLAEQKDGAPRKIVLTDLPNALPLLSFNCELNCGKASIDGISLTPESLAWGAPLPQPIASKMPFDLVLMADLIYWPGLHNLLLKTCLDLTEDLSHRGTVFLIAYRQREQAVEDSFWHAFGQHFHLDPVSDWGWNSRDDGRLFVLTARRTGDPPGAGADQFEALKMMAIEVD